MARRSKCAQIEALEWKLTATPIPQHVPAAPMWRDPRTGRESGASEDHQNPIAWVMPLLPGRNLAPAGSSISAPIRAVRWAWEQATAPELPIAVGGMLAPTTPAEALAKLQVVAGLFSTSRGRRAEAVRAVAADLGRVLGEGGGQ